MNKFKRYDSIRVLSHSLTRSLIYAFCLCAFGTCPAGAASFDCTKASTDVEKAICGDKAVSALDDTLADVYQSVIAINKNSKIIRAQQKAWLSVIRNREYRYDLKRIYSDRIELLSSKEPLLTNVSGDFECKIDLSKDKPEESSRRSLMLAVSEGKIVAFNWYAVLIPHDDSLREGFHYSTNMWLADMNYIEAPGYVSLQNKRSYGIQESCDVVISKHESMLHVFTVGCGSAPETSRFYYVFEQNGNSCILAKDIATY